MNRADRMIGLAMKAGRIISGGSSCEDAVRDKKAKLVLLANDASENTKKRIQDKCRFYQVPLIRYSEMDSLGRIIGKSSRSTLAVTDEGFAKEIEKTLNAERNNEPADQ